MNRLSLFRILSRHRHLSERRAVNYGQNKAAKYIMLAGGAMVLIYLVGFAIMLAMLANKDNSVTGIELIVGISPFILLIDFLLRFIAQHTPYQIIKPYVLTPIPRYACIDTFIATSLFNWSNLTWFIMLIPYCLMSVVFSYGIMPTLGTLFFLWILILANSQWYLIVRTLIIDNLLWWILPIVVYATIATPIYIGENASIDHFFDLYGSVGTVICQGNPLPYAIALAILCLLTLVNRRLQYAHVWKELASTKGREIKNARDFGFLERYGEIGEYLKLEIKTIARNKNPRKSFIMASVIVVLFSLLISFTTIYDNRFMTNFWCIYDFAVFGAMTLIKVMCNEGNYIDALMVHRQNLLKLLHAKYIFYCAILLFPFILMLPTVFMGKWSILMLVSYGVFTAGFQFFIFFQMAVYNNQTLPLNTKFISKGNMNNYTQMLASTVIFIVPMAIVSTLQALMSNNAAYIVMLVIGLCFILTNKLWLKNIYNRMMRRRYANLESFHASR